MYFNACALWYLLYWALSHIFPFLWVLCVIILSLSLSHARMCVCVSKPSNMVAESLKMATSVTQNEMHSGVSERADIKN